MSPNRRRIAAMALVLWLAAPGRGGAEAQGSDPGPGPAGLALPRTLQRGHSHNDYFAKSPLAGALELGFGSVEADIFLVDGRLLVAHDLPRVRPERTLEAMYLDPLADRVRTNGGRVHRDATAPFVLLVDIKSAADTTYAALRPVLARHAGMLTRFENGRVITGAVMVVLSGDRPVAALSAETNRLAALDGRLVDLTADAPASLVPLVSDNWPSQFAWRGTGPVPDADLAKLRRVVTQAHEAGRRIRFWGAPDRKEIWELQFREGVDLINTDKLAELARFLGEAASPAPGGTVAK